MNVRTFLITGMLVLFGVGAGNFPSQELAQAQDVNQDKIRLRDVAEKAYRKLASARFANPKSISDEALSGTSLEWFKAEIALAKSKSAAIKAAKEYLAREAD